MVISAATTVVKEDRNSMRKNDAGKIHEMLALIIEDKSEKAKKDLLQIMVEKMKKITNREPYRAFECLLSGIPMSSKMKSLFRGEIAEKWHCNNCYDVQSTIRSFTVLDRNDPLEEFPNGVMHICLKCSKESWKIDYNLDLKPKILATRVDTSQLVPSAFNNQYALIAALTSDSAVVWNTKKGWKILHGDGNINYIFSSVINRMKYCFAIYELGGCVPTKIKTNPHQKSTDVVETGDIVPAIDAGVTTKEDDKEQKKALN